MTGQSYKIVYKGGEAEITEKRSRFIAHVAPAETEEEALAFIEEIRKKYWDARHNCTAYSVGIQQPVLRCSDDGEPSKTAGMPMMEVIQGEELHNIVVVVTRYFGGTLLGTGGLIRAYTKSAQEGIRNSQIITKHPGQRMKVKCDYTSSGKIQYITASEHIPVLNVEYTDEVEFDLMVPEEQVKRIKKQCMEVSGGKALIEDLEKAYFAEIDGEIKVFL